MQGKWKIVGNLCHGKGYPKCQIPKFSLHCPWDVRSWHCEDRVSAASSIRTLARFQPRHVMLHTLCQIRITLLTLLAMSTKMELTWWKVGGASRIWTFASFLPWHMMLVQFVRSTNSTYTPLHCPWRLSWYCEGSVRIASRIWTFAKSLTWHMTLHSNCQIHKMYLDSWHPPWWLSWQCEGSASRIWTLAKFLPWHTMDALLKFQTQKIYLHPLHH